MKLKAKCNGESTKSTTPNTLHYSSALQALEFQHSEAQFTLSEVWRMKRWTLQSSGSKLQLSRIQPNLGSYRDGTEEYRSNFLKTTTTTKTFREKVALKWHLLGGNPSLR